MTLTQERTKYTQEMTPAGLEAGISLIDSFLTEHQERNMFSRREVVDLLLDIRYSLQNAEIDSLEKSLTDS